MRNLWHCCLKTCEAIKLLSGRESPLPTPAIWPIVKIIWPLVIITVQQQHTLREPASCFDFHARKAECTVALDTDDSRVWTVVVTPDGSSNSWATADAHRAKRSSIKTTLTAAILNNAHMSMRFRSASELDRVYLHHSFHQLMTEFNTS